MEGCSIRGLAEGASSKFGCAGMMMDLGSKKVSKLKSKLGNERRRVKYLLVSLVGSWLFLFLN